MGTSTATVDDDHVFERGGIEQEEQQIGGGDEAQFGSHQRRRQQRGATDGESRGRGDDDRKITGRDRPQAFQRVLLVGFAIGQVIEDIDRARQTAEHREHRNGGPQCVDVEQASAEHESGKYEQVLRPLLGTKRHEQHARDGRPPRGGLVHDDLGSYGGRDRPRRHSAIRQTLADDEKLRTASASLS